MTYIYMTFWAEHFLNTVTFMPMCMNVHVVLCYCSALTFCLDLRKDIPQNKAVLQEVVLLTLAWIEGHMNHMDHSLYSDDCIMAMACLISLSCVYMTFKWISLCRVEYNHHLFQTGEGAYDEGVVYHNCLSRHERRESNCAKVLFCLQFWMTTLH